MAVFLINKKNWTQFRKIVAAFPSPLKFRIFVTLTLTFATVTLNVMTPLIFLCLIEKLSTQVVLNNSKPILIFASYALIWTLARIVDQARTMVLGRVAWKAVTDVSQVIFNKLLNIKIDFHHERKLGEIMSKLHKAETAVSNLVWQIGVYLLPTLLEIIFVLSVLYYYCGIIYALSLMATLIAYALFTVSFIRHSVKAQNNSRDISNKTYGAIGDILLNYETVKLFGREKFEQNLCSRILKTKENASVKRMLVSESIMLGQKIILGIGLVVLTVCSALGVQNGVMKVSDFILITSYFLQFYNPLNMMASVFREVTSSYGDVKDIRELLANESEEDNGLSIFPPNFDVLKFQNVSFLHSNKLILNNISFMIRAGCTTAILGKSGSGKSTLTKLLYRFYNLADGNITIDNINLQDIQLTHLRNEIAIVPQDIVLFNNTISYNILYGSPSASSKEIDHVIQLTQLGGLINSLPNKILTMVGERGLKLSGGEKQRIGIARALLKKPKILILDEATNSLDLHTEKLILDKLQQIMSGITIILISHRISYVVRDASNIVLIQDGQILEQGVHGTLLKTSNYYKYLWNIQNSKTKDNLEIQSFSDEILLV